MHAITIPNLVVALMGSVVAAQTSSVANLYLLGFDSDEDQPPFVGSIIASVSIFENNPFHHSNQKLYLGRDCHYILNYLWFCNCCSQNHFFILLRR